MRQIQFRGCHRLIKVAVYTHSEKGPHPNECRLFLSFSSDFLPVELAVEGDGAGREVDLLDEFAGFLGAVAAVHAGVFPLD